jgi:hypothetical protein
MMRSSSDVRRRNAPHVTICSAARVALALSATMLHKMRSNDSASSTAACFVRMRYSAESLERPNTTALLSPSLVYGSSSRAGYRNSSLLTIHVANRLCSTAAVHSQCATTLDSRALMSGGTRVVRSSSALSHQYVASSTAVTATYMNGEPAPNMIAGTVMDNSDARLQV